jgi:hypothetical protein
MSAGFDKYLARNLPSTSVYLICINSKDLSLSYSVLNLLLMPFCLQDQFITKHIIAIPKLH